MQPHDIHLQLSRGCAKSDITIDFGMSGYTALCRRCGWARRRPPFPMLQGRLVLPSAPMSRRSAAEIERDEALNDGREDDEGPAVPSKTLESVDAKSVARPFCAW